MDYITRIQQRIVLSAQEFPLLQTWKEQKQSIVFTNGCFDLLHRGHVDYLARASSLGDKLIIGLNTDASVRRLKGSPRPLTDEYSRAFILAALVFVDAVILFEEDTPLELIEFIQPDVLVKGSDYDEESIVGADLVKARGGKVATIELVPNYSTSALVDRLKNG
jgi:rfaE bifunctional protein nucleotidyltransferase chain/domain